MRTFLWTNITALKRKKFICLRDGTWLNDEVINFYMKILQEYADTSDNASNCSYSQQFLLHEALQGERRIHVQKRTLTRRVDFRQVFGVRSDQSGNNIGRAAIFIKKNCYYDSMAE